MMISHRWGGRSRAQTSFASNLEKDSTMALISSDRESPGPARDLIGYGRYPPAVVWPNGARVVISVVINYESGAEYSYDEDGRNDTWGEYSYQVGPEVRDLGTETHFEFGSRAGIWRLARLFDRAGVPVSVGVCHGSRGEPRGRRVDRRGWSRASRAWLSMDGELHVVP